MEEKKKSGKGKTVFIVFLILVIIGLSTYICYDKFLIGEKKCETLEVDDNEEENVEILDIYSKEVQNLYNETHPFGCLTGFDNLYYKGAVTYSNLKNYAFYMGVRMLEEEKNSNTLDSFTYDEVNAKAKTIFGKDFVLEDKEYSLCPYKYDSQTKTYTVDKDGGCGCTTGPEGPIENLYKAIKKDNTIEIYEAVIYSKADEEGNIIGYYKDALYNQKINDACYDEKLSSKACIDGSTKYKYIFEKEKDNYILKNVYKDTE